MPPARAKRTSSKMPGRLKSLASSRYSLVPAIAKDRKCYLVDGIPLEIRKSIFEYVLVRGFPVIYTIKPCGKTVFLAQVNPPPKNFLALSRTCKQLYFETVEMYYSSHAFHFISTDCASKALRELGLTRRQHIRNVVVRLSNITSDRSQLNKATVLLGDCNLKALKVIVDHKTAVTRFNHNLLRAAGVKNLRKIRGCEEVHVQQDPLPDHELARGYEQTFTEEQIREFERVLREELCRERETEVKVVKEIRVEDEEDE